MNTTATHDTKRGEDARARINVLSELPALWDDCLRRWSKLNRPFKRQLKGAEAPDRNDEYFLYQTMIGAFPATGDAEESFAPRLRDYVVKAVREAKVHTEWLKPDIEYEEAFANFVEKLLEPSADNRFLADFVGVARRIAYCGMFNSLAQLLLKVAAPGVADFYQGSEFWDLSFVDPDNRRQVDFIKRRQWLDKLKRAEAHSQAALVQDLLVRWPDGGIKMYLIYKLSNFRRRHPDLFIDSDYVPLGGTGELNGQICAFARRTGPAWALAMVPCLISSRVVNGATPLGRDFWQSTTVSLPAHAPRRWSNILTGELLETNAAVDLQQLPVAKVFQRLPVALLYSCTGPDQNELYEEQPSATSFEQVA